MFPTFHEACISYILIAWMVGISVWCLFDRSLFVKLRFYPHAFFKGQQLHTLFTSAFVHTGFIHLSVNTLCLITFLSEDEYMMKEDYGPLLGSLFMFLLTGIFAIVPLLIDGWLKRMDKNYTCAGASAMIFATLMFYFFYFPMDIAQMEGSNLPSLRAYHMGLLCIAGLFLSVWLKLGPAAPIHLYGGLTGSLFAVLFA